MAGVQLTARRESEGRAGTLRVRPIFAATTPKSARRLLGARIDDEADRAPKAIACLGAGFDDATAVLALPEPYR